MDRTIKTTINLYPIDVDVMAEIKGNFKETDLVFNFSEFARYCLRNPAYVVNYKEQVARGKKY